MKTQSKAQETIKSDWTDKPLTFSASRHDDHVILEVQTALGAVTFGVWFNTSELPKLIALLESVK